MGGANSASLELELTLSLSDFSCNFVIVFLLAYVSFCRSLSRALELSLSPDSTTWGRSRQAEKPYCTDHESALRDCCLAPSVQKGEGFEDQGPVWVREISWVAMGGSAEVAGKAR